MPAPDDLRAHLLPILDVDDPVVVRIRHEPDEPAQRLLVALGAGWIIDPLADRCVRSCGHEECRVTALPAAAVEELIVLELVDGVADVSVAHLPAAMKTYPAGPKGGGINRMHWATVVANGWMPETWPSACGDVERGSIYARGGSLARIPICAACSGNQTERRQAMSVVETRTCKIEGCDQPANTQYDRGMLFGYCATHLETRREEISRENRNRAAGRSSSPTGPIADGYTARVRALIAPAKSLDQARRKLDAAGTNEQLQNEFAEASRRATAVPNGENLERLEKATKALRRGAPQAEKARTAFAAAERTFKLALAAIANDFRQT